MLRVSSKEMDYGVPLALLLLTLVLGFYLDSIAFDDPFVTYRYARNVRAGEGLVYNPGEHVLSTTAPLYALLLAMGGFLTANLPALSNGLGIISLFIGGSFIYLLCTHFGQRGTGVAAAFLFITTPLLWLSLGFETTFYLALILGAFYFYFKGHLLITSALLALALLTRGDGILPAAVLGTHYWITKRRVPWYALLLYLALSAPFLLYLTRMFGSPLPVTLAAKSAQAQLGVTGFYAHTTFLQGASILIQAYIRQSILYVFSVLCMLLGIISIAKKARWLWPMLLWALLYFGSYCLLRVAPYHWYYAPLVPAIVLLIALGLGTMVELTNRHSGDAHVVTTSPAHPSQTQMREGASPMRGIRYKIRTTVAIVLGLLLIAPQMVSNVRMYQALLHPGSTPPESKIYKVLPEAKVAVYRQVGEWLKANTSQDALIGVTEVGVIGYYAERKMVDFLGLLRPEVTDALKRGDMAWALLYYQPDYVVLTRVNPLYSYDLRTDEWFRLAYQPLQVFEDARFWGSPVTVYRRQTPRPTQLSASEIPPEAIPLHIRFGAGIELLAYTVDKKMLRPGDILNVMLYWKCLATVNADYTIFVHLLGQHELVITQQDTYPCLGACPTRGWKVGDIQADPHMLALPVTTFTPDEAQLEVGLYKRASQQRLVATTAEGQPLGDNARFETLTIAPAQTGKIPNAMQVNLSDQIALVGYNLDRRMVQPGQTLHLTLYWQALQPMRENYSVFTHLLEENGERIAQMDSWPQHGNAPTSTWQAGMVIQDEYELTIPANAPPGVYSIHAGLYLAETGTRLWVLDASGQPQTDHIALTKVRILK